MNADQARGYISLSLKEGYMSEEQAEELLSLPEAEMIKEVEKMAARGDAEADRIAKKE